MIHMQCASHFFVLKANLYRVALVQFPQQQQQQQQ
jgi:hypothetical protein